MNATLRKFGHPASLIGDYRHWCVLLRPQQVTLGALVLGAKSEAMAFPDLPAEAFTELHRVTVDIETALKALRPFGRINYLMLMMVDPNVHFHVIPRYAGAREWPQGAPGAREFVDVGWPKVPDLGHAVTLEGEHLSALVLWLQGYF